MDRLSDTIKGYIQRHRTIFGSVSSVLNATILFVPSSSRYYEVIAEGMHAHAHIVFFFHSIFLLILNVLHPPTHYISISISISYLYLSPPLPGFLHLSISIDRCSTCLHTLTFLLTHILHSPYLTLTVTLTL